MDINLVHLVDIGSGGWVTNTAHLTRGLLQGGHNARIFKLRRHVQPPRDFGYDVQYQNLDLPTLRKLPHRAPTIVAATSPPYWEVTLELLSQGAWIIIHDPNEIKNALFYHRVHKHKVIVHRQSMLRCFPSASHVPHLYIPAPPSVKRPDWKHRKLAVSLSRVDFDKHTEWILAANDHLPTAARVDIFGAEHRPYTRLVIKPRWPWWVQKNSSMYDRKDPNAAVKKASSYKFMVDMSAIKGDGAGVQFTFLEAIDAGCVCILNTEWTNLKGDGKNLFGESSFKIQREMIPEGDLTFRRSNCLAVKDDKELRYLLLALHRNHPELIDLEGILQRSKKLLRNHSAERVSPILLNALQQG